jgi:hypothetical protein
MARGSISHIALTVSEPERSTEFYNKVFEFIGFKRVEVAESIQQAMKTRLKAWVGPGYSISIRPSKGEFAHRLHDRTALDLSIWPSLRRTDRTLRKCTSSLKQIGATPSREGPKSSRHGEPSDMMRNGRIVWRFYLGKPSTNSLSRCFASPITDAPSPTKIVSKSRASSC